MVLWSGFSKVQFVKNISSLLIFQIILFASGCTPLHQIGSSMKIIKSEKDLLFDEIRYIATDDEEDEYSDLLSKESINEFITAFWEKRDPTPDTEINELKNEYYKRKDVADKRFFETSKGSLTNRGRVLILYGEPDRIDYYENDNENYLGTSKVWGIEIWIYDRIPGTTEMPNLFSNIHRGKMKFVFADLHGFGNYSQIYSSEKNESIDGRVFLINRDR